MLGPAFCSPSFVQSITISPVILLPDRSLTSTPSDPLRTAVALCFLGLIKAPWSPLKRGSAWTIPFLYRLLRQGSISATFLPGAPTQVIVVGLYLPGPY